MSDLIGKPFPEGVTFTYVPPTPDKSEVTACGIPIKFDASKEFKDKKVVIVAVPGAFTPTCQADHLSGYIKKLDQLKKSGVDLLIFIAYNDPFVMSAWGKANGITDDKIVSTTPPPNAGLSSRLPDPAYFGGLLRKSAQLVTVLD
jgi:alkyl hydroperoxide reductase 1